MDKIRAVLIDPDATSRESIRRVLEATGRVLSIESLTSYDTPPERLAAMAPDLVVINLDTDPEAGLSILRAADAAGTGVAILPASARQDSDLLLSVMRAGAREFLTLPPEGGDLVGILTRLIRPREHAKGSSQARRGPGLIAVAGACGGIGCSTLAINIAISLARDPSASVLLADFDILFGSTDVALDIIPEFTLLEATQKVERLDEALLQRGPTRHDSGLRVLPRPLEIEDAARIDPDAVRRLLIVAKSAYSSVVVDASKSLQTTDLIAFEQADAILVVVTLDVFGLRNATRLLKVLRQDDFLAKKVRIVANRVAANEGEISPKKAEATLGAPVEWQVPNASRIVHQARSKGVPIGVEAPGSKVHQAILEIAHALRPFPEVEAKPKQRRGFFAALY